MPYLKQEQKAEVDRYGPLLPGELNYTLTTIMLEYWNSHKLEYRTLNDIMGAVESAKLEFYRRVVIPFEEEKIKTNGDIY